MMYNYMVVRKEYRNMIPFKAMLSMDFVAVNNGDGSYEILKNRFNSEKEIPDEKAFVEFITKHVWKKNDNSLS